MSRTLPHVALSAHPHDRHGLRRADAGWLERQWSEPTTRVLVIAGTRVRPVAGRLDWVGPAEAPAGTRLLLGERDGVTYFAVIADASLAAEELAEGERPSWLPLRGVLGMLSADDAESGVGPLVLHAIGLAEWHWVTRFCPRCGGALEAHQEGHVLRCVQCRKEQFPRTDPAVIMVVTDGESGSDEERCLLGRSPLWPEGRFSTLAGFVEPGETMEDAVRREVFEETGVHVGEVGYFDSQPWPLPASLMIGFTGRALSTQIDVDGSEIAEARWFTRAQMRAEAEAGTLKLPSGVSISRSLIESWYGEALPGSW